MGRRRDAEGRGVVSDMLPVPGRRVSSTVTLKLLDPRLPLSAGAPPLRSPNTFSSAATPFLNTTIAGTTLSSRGCARRCLARYETARYTQRGFRLLTQGLRGQARSDLNHGSPSKPSPSTESSSLESSESSDESFVRVRPPCAPSHEQGRTGPEYRESGKSWGAGPEIRNRDGPDAQARVVRSNVRSKPILKNGGDDRRGGETLRRELVEKRVQFWDDDGEIVDVKGRRRHDETRRME